MSLALYKVAERLGVRDSQTIKKTEEFLRSLQTKGSLKALNDNAKPILCMNLAANLTGNSFNKDTAIILSGLSKSAYRNNLRILQNLLESKNPLTVSELCVRLGCTVVKELAEEILDKYGRNDTKVKDLDHPQYVAAAVYTACKIRKIKIEKSQCLEASSLKPVQWKELIKEIENFATTFKIGSSLINRDLEKILEPSTAATGASDVAVISKVVPDEELAYDVWKKKILEEAYAALDMEEDGC